MDTVTVYLVTTNIEKREGKVLNYFLLSNECFGVMWSLNANEPTLI